MNVKNLIRGSKSPTDKFSCYKVESPLTSIYSKPMNLSQPRKVLIDKNLKGSFKENQTSTYKVSSIYQKAKNALNIIKPQLQIPRFDKSIAMFNSGRPRSSSKKPEVESNTSSKQIDLVLKSGNRSINSSVQRLVQNKALNCLSGKSQIEPKTISTIPSKEISKQDFKFHMIVGKGGFGKVWIVTHLLKKKYFALKEMSKARILSKKSISSIFNERKILTELQGTFIVNMKWAFQDRENLYLVLDLLTGGDMRFHLCYQRIFTEEQTKFFAACILLALELLHKNGYIHRDLKPENLVFDEKGFLCLTDFGIARKVHPDNAKETSGTPGYMAPEVMCRQNHGFEVDYYALGVICYESMLGVRPYNGRSRKEIRDQILAKQVQISESEVPKGWSLNSVDFINRMIQRKSNKRLGVNGISEIMNHPWFDGFDWKKLQNKEVVPPYTPNIKEVFEYLKSLSEDNSEDEEEEAEIAQYELQIRRKSIQDLFKDYDIHQREEINYNMPRNLSISSTKTNKIGSNALVTGRLNVERSESGKQLRTDRLKKLSFVETSSNLKKPIVNRAKNLSNNIPLGVYTKLENIWKNNSKRIA